MSEVAELFLGWSNGGSLVLYTHRFGAQEEPFDHPVWLCVCTLGLHTFTLVLNPVTRVWLNCDQGTFKTRLCGLLRNRQQSCVVREVSLVIPGGLYRLCPCKPRCECAGWTETSKLRCNQPSGTTGPVNSKWTRRTRPAQCGVVEVYTLLVGRPLLGGCVCQPNCKTSLGDICIR